MLPLLDEKKIETNVAVCCVVTLTTVFRNIYLIFRPIALLKHMLITNHSFA